MLMATPLGDGVVHSSLRPAEVSNVSQVILWLEKILLETPGGCEIQRKQKDYR